MAKKVNQVIYECLQDFWYSQKFFSKGLRFKEQDMLDQDIPYYVARKLIKRVN